MTLNACFTGWGDVVGHILPVCLSSFSMFSKTSKGCCCQQVAPMRSVYQDQDRSREIKGDQAYANIVYRFVLRRKPLFLLLNFMVPNMVLSFLTVIVFVVPVHAGISFIYHIFSKYSGITLQTHHVYSTFKQGGNGHFHVISTRNTCGMFVFLWLLNLLANNTCR